MACLPMQDQVGLLALDELLASMPRDRERIELRRRLAPRMARSAPIARPVRSCSCGRLPADADEHDLARRCFSLHAQRFLDGDLVERVDHPLDVVGGDAGAVGLILSCVSGSGTRFTVTRIFTGSLLGGNSGTETGFR